MNDIVLVRMTLPALLALVSISTVAAGTNDTISQFNQRHQQTQLRLQQQRLDNQLAQLQLDYAKTQQQLKQLAAGTQPVSLKQPTILSTVQLANYHSQLQQLGTSRRWVISTTAAGQR